MKFGKLTVDDLINGNIIKNDTILTFDRNAVLNMVYDQVSPLAIKLLYVALSRLSGRGDKIKINLSDLSLVGFSRINLQKRNFLKILEELTHNYFIEDLGFKREKGYGFLRNVYEYNAYQNYVIVDINAELVSYFMEIKPFLQCKLDLIRMKQLRTKSHLKFWELFEAMIFEKSSVEFELPIEFVSRYMYRKEKERQSYMLKRFYSAMDVIRISTHYKIRYKINKEANKIVSIKFFVSR